MKFDPGFDDVPPSAISNDIARLAAAMSQPVYHRNPPDHKGRSTGFSASGTCNQEPCYEELLVQLWRGVKSQDLRAAAIDARKAVSLGQWPLTPEQVRIAVTQACRYVDQHRKRAFELSQPPPRPGAAQPPNV